MLNSQKYPITIIIVFFGKLLDKLDMKPLKTVSTD